MYFSLIVFFILMIPPVVILAGIKKQASPYAIIYASIVAISIATIGVLAMARMTGTALGEQFMQGAEQVAAVIAGSEELAAQAGLAELSYAERVSTIVRLYSAVNTMLPSTIIVSSAIYSYLLYMLVSKMFKKIGKNPVDLVPMRFFRWPPSLFFGYLFLSVLAMLMETIDAFATANIFINISMIFEYVLAVQGLGAVFMLLHNKKIPKAFGVVAGIIGFSTGIGRMTLFAVGMFDYILSPRGRISPK